MLLRVTLKSGKRSFSGTHFRTTCREKIFVVLVSWHAH